MPDPTGLLTEYVIGFLFNSKCEVALIRKNRPDWQRGKWNGIGGHIEKGEAPLQAMEREFKEETGATVKWQFFCAMTFDKAIVHCFRADSDDVEIQTMTDEEVGWHDADELPFNIIPDLSWLIPMALWHEIEPYTNTVEFKENFPKLQQARPQTTEQVKIKVAKWLKSRLIKDRNDVFKATKQPWVIPDEPFESLIPEKQEEWKREADSILKLLPFPDEQAIREKIEAESKLKATEEFARYQLAMRVTVNQAIVDERKAIGKLLQRTLMVKGEIVHVAGATERKVIHPFDLKEIIASLKSGKQLGGDK